MASRFEETVKARLEAIATELQGYADQMDSIPQGSPCYWQARVAYRHLKGAAENTRIGCRDLLRTVEAQVAASPKSVATTDSGEMGGA